MRILHITPTYFPAIRYGGPIQSTHALNSALVRAGHEVTVFTTNIDGPDSLNVPLGVPVARDGVRIYYFPSSFPRSWFYSRALHCALALHIREFDVVHITSVFLAASALGAYYARKFQKPYMISPRGSLKRSALAAHAWKKWIYIALVERRNLAHAAALHFTAPIEQEEYQEEGLPCMGVQEVIPNGIPEAPAMDANAGVAFRRTYNISSQARVVLSLGRLSPIKGFDTLIPAFARVAARVPDAVLVIVGGDERGYRAEIENMIAAHGIVARVIFTGMLEGEHKEAAYRASDVFVMTSISESFGMSAAEAMRAGVASVLTDGVGIAVNAERAGAARMTPKNEIALAHAIEELLQSESLRKEMGLAGGRFVASEYSEEGMVRKFIGAYERMRARLKK